MAHSHSTKAWCVALMCIITIITLTKWERYEISGGELLKNPGFTQGFDEWGHFRSKIIVSDGGIPTVELSVENKPGYAETSQHIFNPERYEYLKLRSDIKTENIIKGPLPSYAARILLVSYDENGHALWEIPYRLILQTGDSGWHSYEKVFRIYRGVSKVRVFAGIHHATGKMWVRNFSLVPAVESESYKVIRDLLIIPWVVLAVWILAGVTSSPGFGASYLVVVGAGMIVVIGIVFPKQMILDIITAFDNQLPAILFEIKLHTGLSIGASGSKSALFSLAHNNKLIHEMAHLILFLVIAAMILRIHSSLSISRRLVYLFLFATVAESLQLFTIGRHFNAQGIAINFIGVTAGYLVYITAKKLFG